MNEVSLSYNYEIKNNYLELWTNLPINDYQVKMIHNNEIPNLLKIRYQGSKLYYLLNRQISLRQYVLSNRLGAAEIERVIESINGILTIIYEYFLDDYGLILDPGLIFIDRENNNIYFTYIPCSCYGITVSNQISSFFNFLMASINKYDEEAIQLLHSWMIYVKEHNAVDIFLEKGETEQPIEVVENKEIEIASEDKAIGNNKVIRERLRHKFDSIKGSNISKEEKLTFIILELLTLGIGILVVSRVLFTSSNRLILILKVIFFGGILILSQVLIFKKAIVDNKQTSSNAEEITREADQEYEKEPIKEIDHLGDEILNAAYLVNQINEKIMITKSPFIIGSIKKDVDLYINNKTVSKVHSRIIFDGDFYYLEDLSSRNGSYVNGDRVIEPIRLQANSRLSFSNESYVFRIMEGVNG